MASETGSRPAPGPEVSRLQLVGKGLSEAVVALRLGFWIVNHRPGLLLLFAFPQFILAPLALGLTRWAGLSRTSLAYSTIFILAALFVYIPVMAAAILEAEAVKNGRILPHWKALREGLRNMRFLLVPFLMVWFGVEAVNQLLLLSIPVAAVVAPDPEALLAVLGVVVPVATVANMLVLLFFASRLLIALPDRVLSEEDRPQLWPMLLVLGLVGARFAVGGSTEGLGQAGADIQGLEGVGLATLGAMVAIGAALLALLLLSLAGKIPAGLRWSWQASRDLDLWVSSLALVVVLGLLTPRAWVFLTTAAGGDNLAMTGIQLYILAVFLVAAVFGQWVLGILLSGALLAIVYVVLPLVPTNPVSHLPYVNPFVIAAVWVVPLTLLTVSTVSLYFRMTEAE